MAWSSAYMPVRMNLYFTLEGRMVQFASGTSVCIVWSPHSAKISIREVSSLPLGFTQTPLQILSHIQSTRASLSLLVEMDRYAILISYLRKVPKYTKVKSQFFLLAMTLKARISGLALSHLTSTVLSLTVTSMAMVTILQVPGCLGNYQMLKRRKR